MCWSAKLKSGHSGPITQVNASSQQLPHLPAKCPMYWQAQLGDGGQAGRGRVLRWLPDLRKASAACATRARSSNLSGVGGGPRLTSPVPAIAAMHTPSRDLLTGMVSSDARIGISKALLHERTGCAALAGNTLWLILCCRRGVHSGLRCHRYVLIMTRHVPSYPQAPLRRGARVDRLQHAAVGVAGYGSLERCVPGNARRWLHQPAGPAQGQPSMCWRCSLRLLVMNSTWPWQVCNGYCRTLSVSDAGVHEHT